MIEIGEEKASLDQLLQTPLVNCYILSSVYQHLNLWHYRQGHIPFSNMKLFLTNLVPNLQITKPQTVMYGQLVH